MTFVVVLSHRSVTSHFVPRTVAALYFPLVRNAPFPSPHNLRDFFFAADEDAFLPFGQLSVSVSVSVVSGRLPLVWLILNRPSKNFAVPPSPAALISTVPFRVSTVVPTGNCCACDRST